MAQCHHLDLGRLPVDDEVRHAGEQAASGRLEVGRPGVGKSEDLPEALAQLVVQLPDVHRPELGREGDCLLDLSPHGWMKPNTLDLLFSALHARLVGMSTDPFAGKRPRILTDADEETLKRELKRRLGEIDRGEVKLLTVDEVWREVFGEEFSGPQPPE